MSALASERVISRSNPFMWLLIGTVACGPPAFATDGYFDPTWAGGGHITFAADFHNPSYGTWARQIVVKSNGNLLLGGVVNAPGNQYWWIGELKPDGTPVLTFGESNGTGLVTGCHLSANLCTNGFSAFGLESDGRIAVLGATQLVRTTADAHALDVAGVAGGLGYVPMPTQINNIQGRLTAGRALARASSGNGKWLVGGEGYYSPATSSNLDYAVVRFNADLSLDPTFNAVTDGNNITFAGGALVAFDLGTDNYDNATATLVQTDDRIVLAGSATTSVSYGLALTRLSTNGALDLSFGGSGTGKILGPARSPTSVITDRAGRMLITLGDLMTVTRVHGDGTPDLSFATEGVSTETPGSCTQPARAEAVALDSAGRILIVGECAIDDTVVAFLVERLFGDDGSLDTTFGIDGFGYGAYNAANVQNVAFAVAFDAGGRPIVGGASNSKVGIARLTYDLVFTNNFEIVPPGRLPSQ